jgi:acyl carrier protein
MADRHQIVESVAFRLREVLSAIDGAEVEEDKDLRDYPGFDSLIILEALVWLETEFKVTIPDEELTVDSFCTVGKMADYVIKHQRKSP